MKQIIIVLIFTFCTTFSFGQDKLVKDIDNDGKNDTVFVNAKKSTIICILSTLDYKNVSSKRIETLNDQSGVTETKNGFEFYNDWMRAGYKIQFRYNSKTNKIQLIGMSRYEFGNAANDGSGQSSVNLLTSTYIGNWSYSDIEIDSLIQIPTIKEKIKFENINFEDFSEETYFNYAEKCAELYNKHKKIRMNKK